MQNYKITNCFLFIKELNRTFCAKSFLALSLYLFFFANFSFTQSKKNDLQFIKTVCIDAGHGGKDPGCHGASVNEKNVCLNIALKLGEKIKEAYPEINVIYTREKDVFVELHDRAAFANKNKADLFICIHANSASPSAYGSETYVLGLHKTEAQKKIADRENSTIYLEDDKGDRYKLDEMTPDAIIIRQLKLSTFLDHSILFASKVQAEFKKNGRYDRGVKQAGFLVLWQTTMPGVLIETGFLTNGQEEQFLASKENQDKMALSILEAFKKYKNQMEGVYSDNKEIVKKVENQLIENDKKEYPKDTVEIVFMVQIKTSESKIQLTSPLFKGLDVFEYKQDNFFKYAVGKFSNDFNVANNYKIEMREKGFENAFVIAFQNGERINLDKALKEIKKNQN